MFHENYVLFKQHQDTSKYNRWLDDLDFGDVDESNGNIKRDVPIIEQLNNLKSNIYMCEEGLQDCAYNKRKVHAKKVLLYYLWEAKENDITMGSFPETSLSTHQVNTQHATHVRALDLLLSHQRELERAFIMVCLRSPSNQTSTNTRQIHLYATAQGAKVVYADI